MSGSAFSDPYAAVLEQLKAGRLAAGLTQSALSKRLGKPQPFISKVEHGVRRIDVVEFCSIALAIGLRPQPIVDSLVSILEHDEGRATPIAKP